MTQQPVLVQREEFETWRMTTRGTVWLERTGHNRFGQPTGEQFRVGPKQQGVDFQISRHDREDNQRRIRDKARDPFRNGTFVRVDGDQQDDPVTASPDALSLEQLLDILDLTQDDFEARVPEMGEVPIRRLHELALQMNAAYGKVTFLETYIKDKWASGSPQKSLVGDGERLS